jgi:hypothetical protein
MLHLAVPYLKALVQHSPALHFEAHVAVRISRALRTIMRNPALASNIDYIEHNFTECGDEFDKQHSAYKAYYTSAEWKDHRVQLKSTASSTWAGDDLKTWEKQLNRYPEVAQLALLLALAPNVTHIYIDIMPESVLAFIGPLSNGMRSAVSQNVTHSDLARLNKVCVHSTLIDDKVRSAPSWFSAFASFLQKLPSLRHYSHGDLDVCETLEEAIPAGFSLPEVEVLHVHEYWMNSDLTAAIISACGPLKTMTVWPEHSFDRAYFADIHPPLLAKKITLQYLKLDLGETYYWDPTTDLLGASFSKFKCLTELSIPEIVLVGMPDDWTQTSTRYKWTSAPPAQRLSTMLPPSLEVLHLNGTETILSDNTNFLWDFIDDLTQLPRLRVIGNDYSDQGPFDKLFEEFSKHGIESTMTASYTDEWTRNVALWWSKSPCVLTTILLLAVLASI